MGLKRPYYQRPIPEDAEKSMRKGIQFAKYRDSSGKTRRTRLTRDGKKLSLQSSVWHAQFTDADGRRQSISTKCRDKEAAQAVYRNILRDVERAKSGILTPEEQTASRTIGTAIQEIVSEYLAALARKLVRGRPVSEKHLDNTKRNLKRIIEEAKIEQVSDLTLRILETWIVRRTTEGDLAPRTVGAIIASSKALTSWLTREGRLVADPLKRLQKPSGEPRDPRRALSPKELASLFNAAMKRPLAEKGRTRIPLPKQGRRSAWRLVPVTPEHMSRFERFARERNLPVDVIAELEATGRERALAYRILVATGLRTGELNSMKVSDLDESDQTLRLRAKFDKGGKGRQIPIRSDLMAELLEYQHARLEEQRRELPRLLRLPPEECLIYVPSANVFEADRVAAGIPKTDERGYVACRHSLRHTHATLHARRGTAIGVAQASMRHVDIRQTTQRYTDKSQLDVALAVEGLDIPPAWIGDGLAVNSTKDHNNEIDVALKSVVALITKMPNENHDILEQVEQIRNRLAMNLPNSGFA